MDTRFKQKRRILASLEAFFGRKTYRGFSERVLAVEDLAPPFQDALRTYIDPDDPVEIILIAPPQSILAEHKGLGWWPKDLLPWEITPDRCLVLTSQNLLIVTLPQHEDKPAVIQIPLGQILSLEVGTILLSAWFDCNWINAGQEEKFHIYFNTVSRSLFEALCHSIRQTINPSTQTAMPADQKHLERLNHLPYKFKNLIPLRLLLPGEQIRAAVYRPAMWNERLFRLHRCVASQMAVVLTNSFLIVTQEQVSAPHLPGS